MKHEFKHIIEEVNENEKNKQKEIALNEVRTLYESFTTVEYYSISKLTVLRDYLSDLAIDFPSAYKSEKDSVSNRIRTQLTIIERILSLPDHVPAVIDGDYLVVLNAYGYRSSHCKGRLYGHINTMTRLSRQCRYYLFKDDYFDLDLKNAHPAMLLAYANENDIDVPVLESYVKDREEFLANVVRDGQMSRSKAKTHVLRAINLVTDFDLPDDNLKALHKDILPIRNHLFNANLKDQVSELGQYCLTRDSFKGKDKDIEKLKISLQSQFCATQESKSLEVLREVCLQKGKLDREAKLDKETRNLSFIPFFDGAYIRFSPLSRKSEVEMILEDTNRLVYPYIFELKDIEPEWSYICEKDLKLYEEIIKFLGSLSVGKLEKLLVFLEIPAFSLKEDQLKSILEKCSSKEQISSLKEGTNKDFNSFISESVKVHFYNIRRKLLTYFQSDKLSLVTKGIEELGFVEGENADSSE